MPKHVWNIVSNIYVYNIYNLQTLSYYIRMNKYLQKKISWHSYFQLNKILENLGFVYHKCVQNKVSYIQTVNTTSKAQHTTLHVCRAEVPRCGNSCCRKWYNPRGEGCCSVCTAETLCLQKSCFLDMAGHRKAPKTSALMCLRYDTSCLLSTSP